MESKKKTRIKRFTLIQRLFHLLLLLTFLVQSATGLGRMYIETSWGRSLAWVFGGYEISLTVHKYVGILMICGFLVYLVYLFLLVKWKEFPGSLFGPDSLVPRPRDVKDLVQHIGWFLGVAKAPRFDRWGYWEKFDYWAVFWGISILGITGLTMAYSIATSRFIPGWGLNVAFWIHRIEALLAMGHIFIIHFFIGHLRRHNFPMDQTMFAGSVDLASAMHERASWVERLKQSGALRDAQVPPTPLGTRILFYLFGYAAMAVGVFLLMGGLVNSSSITW